MIEIDVHSYKGNVVKENDKNDETFTKNVENDVETMGNTGRSSKSLVENTPMKLKEALVEERTNVPYT